MGSGKNQTDSVEKEALARATSLSAVRHIGLVDDPIELYQLSDVIVLPSHREGLPNVLLEGMACGLAPVVTQIGGVTDIIQTGYNGLVVLPKQPTALTEAMKSLAQARDLRLALATAAREVIVANYSLRSKVTAYAQLYQRCTENVK